MKIFCHSRQNGLSLFGYEYLCNPGVWNCNFEFYRFLVTCLSRATTFPSIFRAISQSSSIFQRLSADHSLSYLPIFVTLQPWHLELSFLVLQTPDDLARKGIAIPCDIPSDFPIFFSSEHFCHFLLSNHLLIVIAQSIHRVKKN